MASLIQAAKEAILLEDDDKLISEEMGDEVALNFDIVDVLSDEAIFYELDGGVYVSPNDCNDYSLVANHLIESGVRKSVAKRFINILGASKGKYLADILGFKPITNSGIDVDLSEVDILFGKIYMPSNNGFTATISVEKSDSAKCDISIKIFGVGAGGAKEYLCKITQNQILHATPVDLVIPAKVKLTKWQNAAGDTFYTCHLVNISRRIVGKRTTNPYEGDDGYEVITQMRGVVDRYDTSILHEAQTASEELEENTKINLNVNLALTPDIPAISINGTATVKNKFIVVYSLPVGFKYVTYIENTDEFKHLWAHKC